MRRHQHELLAARHLLSATTDAVPGFWKVLRTTPALRECLHSQEREIADALTALLTGETADPLRSRTVAGLLVTTISTIFTTAADRLASGDRAEDVRRDQASVIDRAFDLCRHGVRTFPLTGKPRSGRAPDGRDTARNH
ncbi:hypothetical protein [Amycolatopsis sp. lyj-23]|uniref:hypothetical protein n=1 Tax=Amycolatopsis sp. lyj-23 TaxID=2789283 RepID=UPI00397A83D9